MSMKIMVYQPHNTDWIRPIRHVADYCKENKGLSVKESIEFIADRGPKSVLVHADLLPVGWPDHPHLWRYVLKLCSGVCYMLTEDDNNFFLPILCTDAPFWGRGYTSYVGLSLQAIVEMLRPDSEAAIISGNFDGFVFKLMEK